MSDSRNGNGTDTSNNHGVLSPQAHVVAASGGNFGFNGIDLMERRGQQLTVAFAGGGDGVVDDNREIEARLRKVGWWCNTQRGVVAFSKTVSFEFDLAVHSSWYFLHDVYFSFQPAILAVNTCM